MLDVK